MKKFTVLMVLLFMIVGCSQSVGEPADLSEYPKLPEAHNYIQKDYDKIVKDLNGKKRGIYFIGYAENEASQDLIQVLNKVLIETEAHAYYIDTRNEAFTTEVYESYLDFDASLDTHLQSEGKVPFIIIINKNEIYTTTPRIDGVDLGEGHLSNVAMDLIQQKLLEVIQD